MTFKEQREFEQLIIEIEKLELEKKSIEIELSSGNLNNDELMKKSSRHGELLNLIDQKSDRWMELSELKN